MRERKEGRKEEDERMKRKKKRKEGRRDRTETRIEDWRREGKEITRRMKRGNMRDEKYLHKLT